MPKFTSDLTSKGFVSTPTRQYEVPDESDVPMEPQYTQADIDVMNQRLAARNLPPIDTIPMRVLEERRSQMPSRSVPQTTEDQIVAARRAKVSGKERLSEGAKRRIEMLLGMFQDTRPVEIDGMKFVLQTLNAKETKEVIRAASVHDGTIMLPYEMRTLYLAYSLRDVADTEISEFIGDDSLEARKDFLDTLPESMVVRLYEEYRLLVKDTNERYSAKTTTEIEEVSEDLKK